MPARCPPMGSHQVYVALGSNLGERARHIEQAAEQILTLQESANLQLSSLYETDPMGPQDQPDYLNAVCAFDWTGTARILLGKLQEIERTHGRVKTTQRWSARPLDLDILLFDQAQLNESDLRIPHIGIAQRSFVLWPLAELAPDLHIPDLGSVQSLMSDCQTFGIKKITD